MFDDIRLQEAVLADLNWHPGLTGSVDPLHDRRVAAKTAGAAPGAVKVETRLEVA